MGNLAIVRAKVRTVKKINDFFFCLLIMLGFFLCKALRKDGTIKAYLLGELIILIRPR